MDMNSIGDPFSQAVAHLLLIYLVAVAVIVCIDDAGNHSRKTTRRLESGSDFSANSHADEFALAALTTGNSIATQSKSPRGRADKNTSPPNISTPYGGKESDGHKLPAYAGNARSDRS